MNVIKTNSCGKANCCGGNCSCGGRCKAKLTCPNQCPKFNTCNAPVCPLDAKSIKMKHISGEKCCLYLLETAKTDAKANFMSAGLGDMYEAIEVVKDDILTSSACIKRTYTRAAKTPSRLQPKFIKAHKPCVWVQKIYHSWFFYYGYFTQTS